MSLSVTQLAGLCGYSQSLLGCITPKHLYISGLMDGMEKSPDLKRGLKNVFFMQAFMILTGYTSNLRRNLRTYCTGLLKSILVP